VKLEQEWRQAGSPPIPGHTVVKENLFLVYSYGQGKYLVAKTIPTPDVVDFDDNY
jgi:hypothetical protein